MPSLSILTLGVATVGLLLPRSRLPQVLAPRGVTIEVRPALRATLAASVAYLVQRSFFTSPRHPFNQPLKLRAKSTLKGLLLQNAADMVEFSPYRAFLHWGTQEDELTNFVIMARVPRIVAAHPEDINYVVNTKISNFVKGRGYALLSRFVGQGLLTIVDEQMHKSHRRVVGPAFSPKGLRHLANVCVPQHTAKAVAGLKVTLGVGATKDDDDCPVLTGSLQEWLDKLTFSVIAQAAFKVEGQNEEQVTEIRRMFSDGMTATFDYARLNPIVEHAQVGRNRIIRRERRNIVDMLTPMIEKVKSEKDKTQEEKADALIDYLVHSHEFTETQVIDHSLVFMAAGFETTSTALGWALYVLAKHPDVQHKLFEEVSSAVSLGSTATMDDVQHCRYLACFTKEILRLHSPVSLIARKAAEDDVLPSGTYISKGTHVIIALHAMHQNPKFWGPDAAEFKPERWEEDGLEERVSGKCYMPFIVGRRNCIGKDFAVHELHLILAVLVRTFEFGWPAGEPEPVPVAQVTTRPKNPINLLVSTRKH